MLRALVESYDKVLEAAHKQPNNSTAPFMRAHRQFEELMRQARAALPVRTPAPATPGHWLGCSLPPEHTGDCLVPRSRR